MDRNEPAGVRLQVRIAHSGLASRRAAEAMIVSGRVSVNGQVVTELGARCSPGDRVEVDGRPLEGGERIRRVLLNKPPGYICSSRDDWGRPLALSLIGAAERLYSVGRLDLQSCGLIIFTNDGRFASILGHPSCGVEKEYLVEADRPIPPSLPRRFTEGLSVEGVSYRAKECALLGPTRARIVLTEGLNREIRVVFRDFGCKVEALRRVRIGPVLIDGLAEGAWRELDEDEAQSLVGTGERRSEGEAEHDRGH